MTTMLAPPVAPLAPPPPIPAPAVRAPYRLSVRQYEAMVRADILTPDDKVELLEGLLVLKMPSNPPHASALMATNKLLTKALPDGWELRGQSAVKLSESMPEPDYAIVRGSVQDYAKRHPGSADIGLVIEIADSSRSTDRRDKVRIYARDGIVCYWIINVVDKEVEVFTGPSGPTAAPAFATHQVFEANDRVPLILDEQTIASFVVKELTP